MITACELCGKIENEVNVKKEKTAKAFAEEVVNVILRNLTEVPNKLFIGYRYSDSTHPYLYRGITNWKTTYTQNYNAKDSRKFYGLYNITEDNSFFDYNFVNKYLAKFGFQITYTTKLMTFTKYTTWWPDETYNIDSLYITAICPLEET